MMMNKKICEQCCHKSICYKYENILNGSKTYSDYFDNTVLCMDLLMFAKNRDNEAEEFTVDANIYDIVEVHENCTVEILKSSVTGAISIGWWRNDNPPFLIGAD